MGMRIIEHIANAIVNPVERSILMVQSYHKRNELFTNLETKKSCQIDAEFVSVFVISLAGDLMYLLRAQFDATCCNKTSIIVID